MWEPNFLQMLSQIQDGLSDGKSEIDSWTQQAGHKDV